MVTDSKFIKKVDIFVFINISLVLTEFSDTLKLTEIISEII